ncbi:MAG: P1 family peptidase [Paracoccaceae bacterium]
MKTGAQNLITDVSGLYVGNAQNETLKSGTTVLTGDIAFIAAVDVMGGAPGTRETDLLAPDKIVQGVDALVLSGGSAFGLNAASGVADRLREMGRGFSVGPVTVPIVPAAILFDLVNGGDKDWVSNPYYKLGKAALDDVSVTFDLGSTGAGTGATTGNLKGGLGSASVVLENGMTVGALVAVNALGAATPSHKPHFWAAPWEVDGEFGDRGLVHNAQPFDDPFAETLEFLNAGTNTTIAIVATDATLTKAQTKRMAVAAQDGMARALVPSHTPYDGDLVFALSTEKIPLDNPATDPLLLGHAAATCLSRAIARGIYSATTQANDTKPTWQSKWGSK